jgi:hypothetical protein
MLSTPISSTVKIMNDEHRDATNLETDLDLASNLWDLDLDLDLYAMFGFGFGFVCYVWIRIWICMLCLGSGLYLYAMFGFGFGFVVQIWDIGLDLFSDLYKSNK